MTLATAAGVRKISCVKWNNAASARTPISASSTGEFIKRDIFEVVAPGAHASLIEHVGTLLDADDPALANSLLDQFEAEAGAATDIEDGLATLQAEPLDSALSHWFDERQFEVIEFRAAPILFDRRIAIGRAPRRERRRRQRLFRSRLIEIVHRARLHGNH